MTPQQKERIVAIHCVPRAETPVYLIGSALLLASEGSAFVTGQSITAESGGRRRAVL